MHLQCIYTFWVFINHVFRNSIQYAEHLGHANHFLVTCRSPTIAVIAGHCGCRRIIQRAAFLFDLSRFQNHSMIPCNMDTPDPGFSFAWHWHCWLGDQSVLSESYLPINWFGPPGNLQLEMHQRRRWCSKSLMNCIQSRKVNPSKLSKHVQIQLDAWMLLSSWECTWICSLTSKQDLSTFGSSIFTKLTRSSIQSNCVTVQVTSARFPALSDGGNIWTPSNCKFPSKCAMKQKGFFTFWEPKFNCNNRMLESWASKKSRNNKQGPLWKLQKKSESLVAREFSVTFHNAWKWILMFGSAFFPQLRQRWLRQGLQSPAVPPVFRLLLPVASLFSRPTVRHVPVPNTS